MKRAIPIILLCFLLFAIAIPAFAAPIVHCGTSTTDRCTVCDLLLLVKNIIDFLIFRLMPVVATLLILAAGVLIITSAGGERYATGIGMIKSSIMGVIIVLSAWLVANTFILIFAGNSNTAKEWYKLECAESAAPPIYQPEPGDPNARPGKLTDADARAKMTAAGINPDVLPNCSEGVRPCGSYQNINEITLNELFALKKRCPSCAINVTDGTGPGHSGGSGHGLGRKIDIVYTASDALDREVRSYEPLKERPTDKAPRWQSPTGGIYALELFPASPGRNHWDIDVPPPLVSPTPTP